MNTSCVINFLVALMLLYEIDWADSNINLKLHSSQLLKLPTRRSYGFPIKTSSRSRAIGFAFPVGGWASHSPASLVIVIFCVGFVGDLCVECALQVFKFGKEELAYVFFDHPIRKRALLEQVGHLVAFDDCRNALRLKLALSIDLKDLAVQALVDNAVRAGEVLKYKLTWFARASRSGEIHFDHLGVALVGDFLYIQDLIGFYVLNVLHYAENITFRCGDARSEVRPPSVAAV